MDLTLALDDQIQLSGQSIDHGHTHTMQTTRELIVVIGELTPRMECRENNFHAWQALFWMNIYWHTTAIITDGDRPVLVQCDINAVGMTRQRLVHTVINDLLGQMIGTACVCVHARALTYRV